MKKVVFDIETSGMNFNKHDVIQIAAQAVDWSTLQTVETFEVKVHFDVERADDESLEVNSFKADVWNEEAVEPKVAIHKWCTFLERHRDRHLISQKGNRYSVAELVGHNADRFDAEFLRTWIQRNEPDMFIPSTMWALDTCQLARWRHGRDSNGPLNYKLETLCHFYNIEYEPHDAVYDVEATRELMVCLRRPMGATK